MRLRILFAMHATADASTAVYSNVRQRSAYLRSAGHTVDVLTVEDLRVRWLPARFDPIVLPLALLARSLAGYDVVVFHSYMGWAFHAARALKDRRHRLVTITMFHGLEPLYHRAVSGELSRQGLRLSARFRLLHHVFVPRLLRFATRRCDGVFCLNRAEADYVVAEGWARASHVHVVRNGFAAEEVATAPRDYQRPRRFLVIAQWLPAKGIRYLVQAFTALATRDPEVELVCAGTGAGPEAVLGSFPEHVRSRVAVFPRLDRSGIREQLRRADAFVFPSLYEGFGIALLEALASGLPVISTPVGMAADMLRTERDALLVPPADAASLEAAMVRLIGDERLRRRIGEAGVAVACSNTWTDVGRHFERELLDVVTAHRAAGRSAADGRLRILFAIHGPCDPATAVFNVVNGRRKCLEATGHAVDVLGADDLRVRSIPPRLNPIVLPLALLGRNLAAYDVILFHSYLGWAFHAFRWLADRRRTPATVTMFHGLEPLYHGAVAEEMERQGRPVSLRFRLLHHVVVHRLLRFACSHSDAVFCLNSAEAQYLESHRWAAGDRIQVVTNAIEDIALGRQRTYASGTRLVTVAQWLPAKGTRYLVDAFTTIARAHPDVTLTCAGTGAGVETVLAAFPEDLRPRVTVLPRLDRAGIFAQLQQADIFVFPSLCEGSSLALIEALAAGLPVVCTGVGAAPDILHPGVDALLVPVADAPALTASIERLMADEALRRQLGESGRRLAARFSWATVCPDYQARLVNLVESHAGR